MLTRRNRLNARAEVRWSQAELKAALRTAALQGKSLSQFIREAVSDQIPQEFRPKTTQNRPKA